MMQRRQSDDCKILSAHIREEKFLKLYLLYGEESYLKSFYSGKIAQKAAGAMPNFNLHRFDDTNFDVDEVEAARDNMPMMSSYSCVVLRDIDPAALDEKRWKRLCEILSDIPDGCVFVLHYDTVEYDKKSSRWTKLIALARKNGMAADIGRLPEGELADWIIKQAKKKNAVISRENARRLMEACGSDMNAITSEIDKLSAFTKGGEISADNIAQLVAKPLDASIYDLAREVLSGRTDKALNVIDGLFYMRENPVRILATMSGTFCDLYRAKAASRSGKRQEDIERDFDYGRSAFRVRNALRDCGGIDINALRGCLALLLNADEVLKSSSIDKRFVLERLVVDMAGIRKRSAY
jgi:DNA polymerase-3 subunit delta